jgi:glycyl-tRNA synthetase
LLLAQQRDDVNFTMKVLNALTVTFEASFNLMFKTSIGPRGDLVGYLRPETAQVWRCHHCL